MFFGQQFISYFGKFSVFMYKCTIATLKVVLKIRGRFLNKKFENFKFVFDWILWFCKYLFRICFHIKIVLTLSEFLFMSEFFSQSQVW